MNNPKHKSLCCVYTFKPPQLVWWLWMQTNLRLGDSWWVVGTWPCWDMDQLVKQSLNSAWKQCSETFWILLTLASKHCLLLSASRLTTQRTKMPFMFFKEGKTLQADSEFPFNCGLSQTSLLFCCAINEKNWKDNAIMLLVSVKRFWSLGLLAIILYTENALEIERNYSRTFIK